MANYRFYMLTAVFCTVIVFGHAEAPKPSTVPITTLLESAVSTVTEVQPLSSALDSNPPIITATSETTSKSTPTSPSTTTTPKLTTPAESTTTTPKPTTPTESTTTTSSTTTALPTTTTPAPGPVPPPQEKTWMFAENGSNVSCIMVHFAAQLDVTYTEMVNSSAKLNHITLNVPTSANVTGGSCGNASQWLTIGWPATVGSTNNNTLTLVFDTNSTTKTYALKQLNVILAKEVFPNATADVDLSHGTEWQTPLATSYRCDPATRLPMASAEISVAANLTVSHLHEEAFRTAPGTGFSAARECGGDDVPDAVPIAVGCALGGLVLVVLAAYLVARRRSAARGYLSM